MTDSLSLDEARAVVLHAQGLVPGVLPLRPAQAPRASAARRSAAVEATLRRLGAVQLDTVSVLARSHELVQYARLGAGRPRGRRDRLLGRRPRRRPPR